MILIPVTSVPPSRPHPTEQFSPAAVCPAIQLDSDTVYLDTASDPSGDPTRLSPLQMPIASPGCHLRF